MNHFAPLALILALGCANNTSPVPGDRPDLESAYLDIVGESNVLASASAEVSLTVRYVDGAGAPIEGGQVGWTVEGESAGASLAASETVTDQDGMATVTLRTGDNGAFGVRAIAAVADPADFRVTVTEGNLVDLIMTPTYEGTRRVDQVEMALFANTTCSALSGGIPMPRDAAQTRTYEPVTFAGVDTASPDAVYAIGFNGEGMISASRCLDVDHDAPVQSFELVDVEGTQGGTFTTRETFDVTEGMPPALDRTLDAMSGLTTDPGGYLVDLAIESGRLPGFAEGLLSLSRGLVGGMLENALGRIHTPGYLVDAAEAGAAMDASFRALTFVGNLHIGEAGEFGDATSTHQLTEMHVPTADGFDVRPLTSSVVDVEASFLDGEVTLAEHDLDVSFGEVVESVLNESVLPRFPGSPETMSDLVAQMVPCDQVAIELAGESATYRDVAEMVCEVGTAYLGELITGWITELFDYDTLTLAGVGTTTDVDLDYAADEFTGTADAIWSGSRGALEFDGELEGALTEARAEREVDRVAARIGSML